MSHPPQNVVSLPVPFMILSADDPGKILYANALAAELFGYTSVENFLSLRVDDLCDNAYIFDTIKGELSDEKDLVDKETELCRKDGSFVRLRIRASGIRDIQGNLESIQIIPIDLSESQEIEKALLKSEKKFRSLYDGVPVGLYRLAPNGEILDTNLALMRMLHAPDRETLLQVNAYDTYVRKEDLRQWQKTLETRGVLRDFEFEIRRLDGSTFWARDSSRAVRDADGNLLYYEGTLEDITERRLAEQALRESEEKYRTLAENTSDIVYSADAEGVLTYLSPQVYHYGFSPDKFTARSFLEAIVPEDRERLLTEFRYTLSTGQEFPSEFRIYDAQGKIHWMEDQGRVQRDENGNIIALVGVLRDITERKKLEEAYRTLVDQSLQGLLIVQDWRVVFANDAFTRITGYSKEELLAFERCKVFELIHPEDRDVIRARHEQRHYGHPEPNYYEHRVVRKDGQIRWVEAYALSIEYQQQFAVQVAYIDVTERKDAEKRAESYKDRLRNLATELTLAEEKERRRFSSALHDDLAQLLTLIKIRLQVLRESLSEPGNKKGLTELEVLVERADRSARSLMLQLSHPALYDMGFVSAVEWLVEDINQLYGISVQLKYNTREKVLDEPIRVILYQCLRELLVNTAKHAQVKEAYVDIASGDGNVRLTVDDYGIGFDADKTGIVADGTGFGLFSIRERLESLGGKLRIHSSPGQGTRIILDAPTKTSQFVK